MGNQHNIEKDTTLWRLNLAMNMQLLFADIKRIADKGNCPEFKRLMAQSWFSGYDFSQQRMLPDGTTAMGAPTSSDLGMRDAIVAEVLDGLKSRPRPGKTVPCSLFTLTEHEYDFVLALCQMYDVLRNMIASPDLNPYEAAGAETCAKSIMLTAQHAEDEAYVNRYGKIVKPLDDNELDAVEL